MPRAALLLLALSLAACISDPAEPTEGAIQSIVSVATETSVVVLDYEGRLDDGTVFDAGEGVTFDLQEMIPGFQAALVGMRAGDTKTFSIPPEEAYGPEGNGPIPPNATLTFEVTVHEVRH